MMNIVAAMTALTVRCNRRFRLVSVMTGLTAQIIVSTGQLKSGCRMIKLPEIPTHRVMTAAALVAK
jgi:hypothetical protein